MNKTTTTDKARAGMLAGLTAGHKQAAIDKRLRVEAERGREVAVLPLADIKPRAGGLDTREPTEEAVADMAETLDALGLIQPLAVDRLGRLLAGKTRLLAIKALAKKNPERWDRVPVRRFDLDAEAEPERALAVEIAENERRKDYAAAEIKALAERLKAAGFHHKAGRPGKGKKALLPALGSVVGKSKRQLLRILEPEKPIKKEVPAGYDNLLTGVTKKRKGPATYNDHANALWYSVKSFLLATEYMPGAKNRKRADIHKAANALIDELKKVVPYHDQLPIDILDWGQEELDHAKK